MKTIIAAAALLLASVPAFSADLPDQFRQVCESPAVKSAKLEAACKAGEAPDALKDGSRFKATGIGAEVNTLFANVAFFVKA